MKNRKPAHIVPGLSRRIYVCLLLCGLLVTVTASVHAQEDGETSEEVIRLSPFQVTTDDDRGYIATTTLSGSRIRTPVEDVGASISIVTEEFLEDTNSTNLRDVLVYTTGTEVTGVGGNFSGSGLTGGGAATESGLGNNPGTRVRGLASATQTRGFFRTGVPFDSYNSNRLEINRGANAILFGVGSPAGIINYSPATADLERRFGSLDFQYGRFGSHRTVFRYNQPFLEEQAAVRIAVLNDDRKFQQKPAFNHDQRIYGALTIEPDFMVMDTGALSGTRLRVGYEWGDIEANNPRSLPPQDRFTVWFEPTQVMRDVGIEPKATHDPRMPFAQEQGLKVAQNLNRSPIIIFPDATSATPQDPLTTLGQVSNLAGRQWVINGARLDGGVSAHMTPGDLTDSIRRMGLVNEAAFYRTPNLNDRSVFDFRNILLDGPNKRENTRISAFNLALEQLFFNDRAGVEVAYDKQTVENDGFAAFQTAAPILSVDINTHLIDGQPNPNFGRPMLWGSSSSVSWNRNEWETTRATAFTELDFAELVDRDWSHWLGRHIITGLFQDEETFTENRGNNIPWYIDGEFPYGNNQNRSSDLGKQVRVLFYVGPSLADAQTAGGANLQGVTADIMDLPTILDGMQFFLREQGGAEHEIVPLNIVRAQRDLSDNAASASKSLREITSSAVNLQSYFLHDHLIFSTGWRREKVDNFNASAPVLPGGENIRDVFHPDYTFASNPDLQTRATLHSWSIVGKTPRSWWESMPHIEGVNFHYNRSENFSPPTGLRFSPFGESLLPPTGDTKDYGFTVHMANDRVIGRVNWYETTQSLVSNDGATGAINSIIGIHNLAFNAVQAGFATDGSGDGFPDGYVPPPQWFLDLYNVTIDGGTITSTNPGVVATGDFVSKGVEMELFLNPTDNWTVAFNAARQESVRDNTGADAARLFFDTPLDGGRNLVDTWLDVGRFIPLFIPAVDQETGQVIPDSSGTLSDWTRRQIINPFNNVRLQDGAPAQELRKWRFNAVTNYRFREGVLSGFNVGGAYRWQDKVAIGFPLTTAPDGEPIIDVENPFFGPTEDNVDLWVGYERPIWNDRIQWRMQLNLRNAFPGKDIIPVFAQPDGDDAIFRVSESRVWSLSSRFSF